MTPVLPVVPAGPQRLIANLYVLETHLDTINWLLRVSPSEIRPKHCEIILIDSIPRVHCQSALQRTKRPQPIVSPTGGARPAEAIALSPDCRADF